jgi:two-component sensor histidine kinase
MPEYLDGLVSAVFATHGLSSRRVHVETRVEPIVLDLDTAVSAGLMANELLTNAVKHAFPSRSEGTITLAMEELEPGRYRLSIADDGIGLPPHVRVSKPDSLGLRLVHELARQLRGTVRREESDGTHVAVEFCAKRVTASASRSVSQAKTPAKKSARGVYQAY